MSAESFLSSAVEAAVGMAGFAGIVVAIRNRDILHWAGDQRLLLQMLLLASAMAVAFALLPAVLSEAGLSEPMIWRIASITLLVWQVSIGAYRSAQFRTLGMTFPSRLTVAWGSGIVILQALNIGLATSWPYLLGIFCMLGNGFTFFLILLIGRNGEHDAAA